MVSNLPNLNGLRAFEAAGRRLNFRAAADELGVTQGAVAQQVRGLETQLGQKLFVRKSKGLAFSASGRAYHGHITEAFAQIRQASELLLPADNKVTISVTPTFAAKWLIPNLPELNAKHPEIDVRVVATENVLSFHSDGIDLAIRQGKLPRGAGLEIHHLMSNEIIAIASPLLIKDAGLPLTLPLTKAQLSDLPKLHDGHDLWPSFLAELGVVDNERRGTRVNQTALAIDAAIAGQGAALASRFLVERELRSGQLVAISDRAFSNALDFRLLVHRGKQRSLSIERVVEWLLTKVR